MPSRPIVPRVPFVAGLALLSLALVGCEDLEGGGGAAAVPEVRLRAAELDDEEVATEPLAESDSEVPVIAPSGEAIVPPEERAKAAAADED